MSTKALVLVAIVVSDYITSARPYRTFWLVNPFQYSDLMGTPTFGSLLHCSASLGRVESCPAPLGPNDSALLADWPRGAMETGASSVTRGGGKSAAVHWHVRRQLGVRGSGRWVREGEKDGVRSHVRVTAMSSLRGGRGGQVEWKLYSSKRGSQTETDTTVIMAVGSRPGQLIN